MIGSLTQGTTIQSRERGSGTLWGVLLALAGGALLGALVAIPFEQAVGLSGTAWTVLRSAVATAVLSGLCTVRPRDLVLDTHAWARACPPDDLDTQRKDVRARQG